MKRPDALRAPSSIEVDDWLDRVQIVDANEDEVASFLDSLDLRGPQEREMLDELARNGTIAGPDELLDAHRRAVAALETLGRHGYRSAVLPRWLRPKLFFRFFVELVARYVVVSYLRRVSTDMRNLYWLRTMQAPANSKERKLLTRVGIEASGLIIVFKRRTLGLPSFVIGGILVPLFLTLFRVFRGLHFDSWWTSTIFALVGALAVFLIGSGDPARRRDGEPADPPRDPGAAAEPLDGDRLGRQPAARPEPQVRRGRDRRDDADVVRGPGGDRARRAHLVSRPKV